ncbi:hypothetical protein HK096_005186 [Nowakowskiella sp. JEL0078]|nr:hypothetical protein HK096_005186 [Nowakowskiella sp. JEL0078]
MKIADSRANQPRYYKINTEYTLRRVLRGKTVIEFPAFIIHTKLPDNFLIQEVVEVDEVNQAFGDELAAIDHATSNKTNSDI